MKRMNEVFELPLPLGEMDCMVDVFTHSDLDIDEPEVAVHTAHAINNVDKLADALDESLAMLFMAYNLHCGTGIDDPVIAKLRAVLDGYRGAL